MRKHLPALRVDTQQPLSLFNNNQSALAIVNISSSTYHSHMKHYNIKLTHLHNTTSQGQVHYSYCPTDNMPADVLTKALSHIKLIHHHQHMGLIEQPAM
jgi:hypothetical protein